MTQVIEKLGGEYRNRTGVHGFASCQPGPTYQRLRVKPEAKKGRNVWGNVKPGIDRVLVIFSKKEHFDHNFLMF